MSLVTPKISFSLADLPLNISLEDMFILAKELTISGVEILPGFKSFPHAEKLSLLSARYNIPILSIHQPLLTYFGIIPIETSFQLAKKFQAKYVLHPLPSQPLLSHQAGRYFHRYQKIAQKYHVEILIENLPRRYTLPIIRNFRKPHPSTTTLLQFKQICDQYGFGITLDTSHLMETIPQQVADFSFIKKYIKNIHLSDFDKNTQHLSLETGTMNVKKFLYYLNKIRYSGTITLELSPKIFIKKEQYINKITTSITLIRRYIYGKS